MANIPIYIPTYINSAEYTPVNVQPRLLFFNGMIDCEKYYIESASAIGGVSIEQTAFPYFDNYNVVTGSFPTVNSKSLLFYNEEPVYGELPDESLYSTYWSNYVQLIYNPRTKLLNASAIIPLADYFNMELNDVVEFRSNYYHLRGINDYNLKNGECSIQLLGPILSDALNLKRVYREQCMGYSEFNCTLSCLDYYANCATKYYEQCMGYSEYTCLTACNDYCNSCDNVADIEYIMMGAGGEAWSGGGGAGQVISGSARLNIGAYYPVEVAPITTGTQPATQVSGGNTTFLNQLAMGGGNGGYAFTASGWNGGSGGGGGRQRAGYENVGIGLFGYDGGPVSFGDDGCGGGGGGAAAAGGASAPGGFSIGGIGGAGVQWFDGDWYAGGGSGECNYYEITSGSYPSKGGGGNWNDGPGGAGFVKLRYPGTGSKASGGTISYEDGYTYHAFNTNDYFYVSCPGPGTTTTTTTLPPPSNFTFSSVDKSSMIMEIFTTASNFQLTIPIYSTVSPQGYKTLFTASWGDGSISYVSGSSATSEVQATHTYTNPGTYEVSLNGTIRQLGDSTGRESKYALQNSLIKIKQWGSLNLFRNQIAYGCDKLIEIPDGEPGLFSINQWQGTFSRPANRASPNIPIPPANLFKYSINTINVSSLFSSNFFLTEIPENFFVGMPNCYFYGSAFFANISLNKLPNNLWAPTTPATTPGFVNISGMFRNDRSIGAIPANFFDPISGSATLTGNNCFNMSTTINLLTGSIPPIWNSPGATGPGPWVVTDFFNNCVNAANYASIPAGWT
jgi:hypothetical protein